MEKVGPEGDVGPYHDRIIMTSCLVLERVGYELLINSVNFGEFLGVKKDFVLIRLENT